MFYLCVFKLFITKAILGFHIQRRKFFGTIRREPGMHIASPALLISWLHFFTGKANSSLSILHCRQAIIPHFKIIDFVSFPVLFPSVSPSVGWRHRFVTAA